MAIHIIRMAVIVTLVSACIFLPFMPGDYDAFSITFSAMAQFLAFASLLLVPPGVLWFLSEMQMRKGKDVRIHRFAGVSLYICIIPLIGIATAAFINNSRFLAIFILLVGGYWLFRIIKNLKKNKYELSRSFNTAPIYLVIVPIAVILIRFIFMHQAVDYSRKTAIRHAGRIITDIELYRNKNGHYPLSMVSLWKDYKLGIVGIYHYQYEQSGDAYNLSFEQFSGDGITKEIVMYNKLDQQEMTSHDQDLLLLSQGQLNAQRGYFRKADLPFQHWNTSGSINPTKDSNLVRLSVDDRPQIPHNSTQQGGVATLQMVSKTASLYPAHDFQMSVSLHYENDNFCPGSHVDATHRSGVAAVQSESFAFSCCDSRSVSNP